MWIGDLVLGRFIVERPAGSGGMGSVFRAVDRETGTPVAVKVMDGDIGGVERFFQEARLLAQIEHAAIVRYVADGVTEQGEPFLVMEWLEGVTLAERLQRVALDITATLELARRAAQGLGAAHARRVVHRDVKPANLFLVDGDAARTKLLDFGVARPIAAARALTATGVVVGSVGYMAPEQARGESEVDARADMFALGCVLFECLAGRPAFAGRQLVAVLAKLVLEQVPRLSELRPDVPEALADLVARMLSKDPEARPADGAAVLREIDVLGTVVGAPPARGEPMSAAMHDRPSALTNAEQRVVSVLLVDPRTAAAALSPTLKSAEGARATNPLSALMRRFGAEPVRMADGCVLATVPQGGSAKDQASRAAACALALASALPDAVIALATGRAEPGRRHPIGTAIDRAAELLATSSAGAAGGIYLDEATRALLDARFEVAPRHGIAVLVGERRESDEAPLLLGRRMPCVGRDKELALLEATLAECVDEPVARAVLVTAPAGVGKTRLRQEFLVRARRAPGLMVVQARGDPFAAGSAHTLARQLIRHAAGLSEGEPAGEQSTKLRTALGRCLDGEMLVRVSDFLGEIVGARAENKPGGYEPSPQFRAAQSDPGIMREWLVRSFEQWLAAECARHPTLIVLEDLHWGDAATVGYLAQTLHACRSLPLMVLALARPEIVDEFPSFWREAGRLDIALPKLTRRAATELVRAALGAVSEDDAVSGLVERADGNAFYLEELVRTRAAGATTIPETVLAMVEARLDALDPNARRLLRAGSVFGEAFWTDAVSSLAGSTADETRALLEQLIVLELLVRGRGDKFPHETEYVFRHGLIRDAAYATLTESDRRTGHRLAGEWLERVGEKDARVLADHFEMGGVPERAMERLIQAAQEAHARGDHEAAQAFAQRGVSLIGDGETVGTLEVLANWRHQPDKAIPWLRRALALNPEGTPAWFAAAATSLVIGNMNDDPKPAAEILPVMLRLSGSEPSASYAMAVYHAVIGLLFGGHTTPALVLLERCERAGNAPAGTDGPNPSFMYWLRITQCIVDSSVRDSVAGMLHNARDAAQVARLTSRTVDARFALGSALLTAGAVDEAERELQSALEASIRLGLPMLTELARRLVAWTNVLDARVADALADLRELANSRRVVTRALSSATLAEALRRTGSLDDAEREARRALDEAAALPLVRPDAFAVFGAILLDQGRPREALDAAEQGFCLSAATASPDARSTLHRVRAEALWALGERDAARAAIAVARERILRIAGEFDETELRRSWLENAVDCARTLELYDAWRAAETRP